MYSFRIALLLCSFGYILHLNAVNDSLRIFQLTEKATGLMEDGNELEAKGLLEQALCEAQNADRLIDYYASIKSFARFQRRSLGDITGALHTYRLGAESWRKPSRKEEWDALAWLYVNEGYTHARVLGNYADAVPFYQKAAAIFTEYPQWEDVRVARFIYQYLGNIYTRLGDYPSAETLLKRSLAILLAGDNFDYIADNYSDLSTLYQNWERYDKALEPLEQAQKLPGLGWHNKGLIYQNIGILNERLDKIDLAKEAVNQSIYCFSEELKLEEPFPMARFQLASLFGQLASLLHLSGATEEAIMENQKASSEMIQFFGTSKRREVGKIYLDLGNIMLEADRATEALTAFQASLAATVYEFSPLDDWALPLEENLRAENTVNEALWAKAKAHMILAKGEQELKHLEHAIACYQLAEKGDRLLMQRYLYDDAKLLSLEEGHQRTEEAIDAALRLADITNEDQYLELAFQFSETSRSLLLWDAFSKAERARYAQDQDYREAEKALRDSLAKAEAYRYEVASEAYPDSVRNFASNRLMRAHQDYRNFIDQRAPELGGTNVPNQTLTRLQAMLQNDHALLSFFPGEEHLFAFYLDVNGLKALRLSEADLLAERVKSLRSSIEQFQFDGKNRDSLCSSYTTVAFDLYQQLLLPIEQEVNLAEKLLIVPGGVLQYLPFAALLTEQPKKPCRFDQYPYLLHQREIGLAYSANLHYQLAQTQLAGLEFAGFAPQFKGEEDWPQLLCSETRLADIADQLGGDYYGKEKASLSNFVQRAGDYGLIQLGTHAKANPNEARFSFIVFSGEEEGSYDSLFINDIYALRLRAELVALSACETAVGEIYQSEGVISLGRAFIAAGARSVISSLWRVNESANCDLLASFYQSLDRGSNKTAALRQAKLDYLDTADRTFAHPAYWAPFQLVGNERSISKNDFNWNYLFGAIGLLLVGWLTWKTLRSRTRLKLAPKAV